MKAPFSYPTAKPQIAREVWFRFGVIDLYVEPFAGAAGVLFARESIVGAEILNDLNGFIANFYRATQRDPEAVIAHATWPNIESDLIARHQWLVTCGLESMAPLLQGDPEWYDPKIAGWWLWGLRLWSGKGWCSGRTPGVGAMRLPKGSSDDERANLSADMHQIAARLKNVTIACGDWKRVVAPNLLTSNTGVFLDVSRTKTSLVDECRQWAISHGHRVKIALYDPQGSFAMPSDWDLWPDGGGRVERVWFSWKCDHGQMKMFG